MDADGLHALFEQVAVATPPRVIVRVRGEKTLAFLHDVATQEIAHLTPGTGALTCFLDDKGRVQAEARALVLADDDVLLDAEPAALPYLTGWLARIAPLSGCEVTDETSAWHLTVVRGPKAAAALGVEDTMLEHSFTRRESHLIVRVAWGLPGFDILAPEPVAVEGVAAVDDRTFEAARIAAGRPRFGIDVTTDSLINETPLLARAVAMEKGCYPGQESVARVHNLGRIRQHLIGLDLLEADVEAGATVHAGDDDVGVITSAAGRAAIARVRAEVQPGASVRVAGVDAAVRAL